MPRAKQFFWKDKSGRDGSNTFNLRLLTELFKKERDWITGELVRTWAASAEVGDKWENAANQIQRIK